MTDAKRIAELKLINHARTSKLTSVAFEVHDENMKWWRDLETGQLMPRSKYGITLLILSEIIEAMEGLRKNLMDEHPRDRPSAEVEAADTVIRVLDLAGALGVPLRIAPMNSKVVHELAGRVGHDDMRLLYNIVRKVLQMTTLIPGNDIFPNPEHEVQEHEDGIELAHTLSVIIESLQIFSVAHGYDLWGAVDEKRAYNRVRADHKPENRMKEGGKKF